MIEQGAFRKLDYSGKARTWKIKYLGVSDPISQQMFEKKGVLIIYMIAEGR